MKRTKATVAMEEKKSADHERLAEALVEETPKTLEVLRKIAAENPRLLQEPFPDAMALTELSATDPAAADRWSSWVGSRPPLLVAIVAKNAAAVEFLAPISDLSERADHGESFLALTIKSKGRLWPFLLDRADVNAKDWRGETPLIVATRLANSEVVNALLAKPECDADARDNDGESALCAAVRGESAELVQRLIAASSQRTRELALETAARRMRSRGEDASPESWACLDLLLSRVSEEAREPVVRWAMEIAGVSWAKRLPAQWARAEAGVLRAEMDEVHEGGKGREGASGEAARAEPSATKAAKPSEIVGDDPLPTELQRSGRRL